MIKEKKCENCNIIFKYRYFPSSAERKYCSKKCQIPVNKTGKYKKCGECGKEIYVAYHANKVNNFCSRKCFNKFKSIELVSIPCEICEKLIFDMPRKIKNRKFCSIKCLNVYRSNLAREKQKYIKTKPELEFQLILDKYKIRYKFQYWVEWKHGWKKFYDFYIPNKNTLIEIDGIYWHGKKVKDDNLNEQQRKTRSNDVIKNELARSQGYNLLRIWSDEIQNFDIGKII